MDSRRLPGGRAGWSLDRLMDLARQWNPELTAMRAKVQTAEASLRTAGERPNPTLSVKPGYNSSTSGISPWIVEPALDWTIETGGKRSIRRAEAAARIRAARLELESAEWKVRSDLRRAFVALYAAEQTLGHYQTLESTQAEALKLLETQRREGAATAQDVTTARMPLNQTRLSLHDTALQAAKARGQMAAALGAPIAALSGVKFDFSSCQNLRSAPARTLRKSALTHRSDILAALADYVGAEERLRLEVAKQYPDIHLGPGYKLDQTSNKWTLGVGFELPILNQHQGAIGEAECRRREAAARVASVQTKAMSEIDLALAIYEASLAKSSAAEALASDARRLTASAENLKREGEGTGIELSQRKIEEAAAQLSREQARLQAIEAMGGLEDALQTPASQWRWQ
jgi:outer membrane protein TolC